MKPISGLVTTGSGSYGRSVWSHNRYGGYIRERVVPVNTNTIYQQTVRNAFAQLASAWLNGLDDAERSGWKVFADAVPVPDKLGNPQILTAQAMYIKCNGARLSAGKTRIDTPPINFTLAAFTLPVLTAVSATDTLSIAFTNTDPWATVVGGHMLVYQSQPQGSTINFFSGPFRYVGSINGAVTPPTSPQVLNSLFPFETGHRIYLKIVVTQADGRPASPAIINDIGG